MKGRSKPRWVAAVVGVVMLLLLAPGAVADQTYGDALGDATNGAPDITAIQVTNDAAGWITFSVRASGLPQGDTFLLLSINADANMATGRSGDDFAVVLEGGSLASIGERWDGTTWAGWAPSLGLQTSFANAAWTVKVNRTDLLATSRFGFWVGSAKSSGGQVIGTDVAPEGADVFTYDVTQPQPTPTPTPTPKPTPTPTPTPTPSARPLAAARLAGEFDMRLRLKKKVNVNAGARDTGTWQFTPGCSRGACTTRVHGHIGSIVNEHSWTIRLSRTGARYAGGTKSVVAECSFKDVVGTTTLNLTVKRASWIDGVWRATAVSGTYVQSAPRVEAGMFYCPAGSATYSFTGTLSQGL